MSSKPPLITEVIKSIAYTLILYATLFVVLTILNYFSPGGPCSSGLGFMLGLFLFPLCWIALMIFGTIKIIRGNKGFWIIIGINLILLVILLIKVNF